MHYDPPVEVLPVGVFVRQTVELFLVHAGLDDQIWRLESGLHGRDYNRFHAVAAQVSKAGLLSEMYGCSCRLKPELQTIGKIEFPPRAGLHSLTGPRFSR